MKRSSPTMSSSSSSSITTTILPPHPPTTPTTQPCIPLPFTSHLATDSTSTPFNTITTVNLPFTLLPLERNIFHILLKSALLKPADLPPIAIRIAGGWVRDKLLNLDNLDVDVALDNCTGEFFAGLVLEYINGDEYMAWEKDLFASASASASSSSSSSSSSSAETTQQLPNSTSVHVIHANPSQSKHLQTSTMRLLGISLDFVNLRSEKYTDSSEANSSRIPNEVQFGSPKEDALRRDFTVNSLFYNVNLEIIEDYTLLGFADLISGILRTPIDPFITFMDDPLRVLRCVRFSSRFNFTVTDEIRNAARDERIKSIVISGKISRERVGSEVRGFLQGKAYSLNTAIGGLNMIRNFEWMDVVFLQPTAYHYDVGSGKETGIERARVLNTAINSISKDIVMNDIPITYLAAVLCELKSTCYCEVVHPPKNVPKQNSRAVATLNKPEASLKRKLLSSFVLKDGLKLNTKDEASCCTIISNWHKFGPLIECFIAGNNSNVGRGEERVKWGSMIREVGKLWFTCATIYITDQVLSSNITPSLAASTLNDIHTYVTQTLNLNDCWLWRPIIDGKVLTKELGVKGPVVGVWMLRVVEWMLRFDGGGKETCIVDMKEIKRREDDGVLAR